MGELRGAGGARRQARDRRPDRRRRPAACPTRRSCAPRSAEAAGIGARPGVLVLTLPDNPTGTVASAEVVREVCEIAEAAGLLIVCDEIYRDLAYEPERFVSPAEVLPSARSSPPA